MSEKVERSRKVTEKKKIFEMGGKVQNKLSEIVKVQVRGSESRNLTTGPERKKDKESYLEKRDIYGENKKENLTVSRK